MLPILMSACKTIRQTASIDTQSQSETIVGLEAELPSSLVLQLGMMSQLLLERLSTRMLRADALLLVFLPEWSSGSPRRNEAKF
jgi:hypothetical protein